MTNNQTIDGLDRETLAFALGFKCHGHKNRTDQQADKQNALDKIRALLDAPAVERDEDQVTLKPFRELPYGTKFRYQGRQEVWVRTQHNVIAAWPGNLSKPGHQSLCCFCHEDGDEDGNTLDTLVEVCEAAPPASSGLTWRAQGDANFYALLKDGDWYAAIQMNGRMWVAEQEEFLNGICPQHSAVADGKARDV